MKNTNADYTHVAMVIDRSGSMGSCWKDVLGGYKELVKINKESPGKCTFTVAVFDTMYELLEDFTDIQAVKDELKTHPRGGTALLDAIGRTINEVGKKLSGLKKKERPAKVMLVIQTDGEENSSHEFTKEQITKMIKEQSDTYKWEFQFIGASLESVNEAESWGIKGGSTSCYRTDNSLATFSLLGEKMSRSRSIDDMEMYSASMAFTNEEKDVMNAEKKVDVKS
jgi:hypothetical protein